MRWEMTLPLGRLSDSEGTFSARSEFERGTGRVPRGLYYGEGAGSLRPVQTGREDQKEDDDEGGRTSDDDEDVGLEAEPTWRSAGMLTSRVI
jgi:hypothetical protein